VLAIFFGGDALIPDLAILTIVGLATVFIPRLRERSKRKWVRFLYILYIIPVLYLLYPVAIPLARQLNPHDYDSTLIAADRFLFGGVDPTRWIFQHIYLAPITVEILQICYYAHYLYPLILGTEFFIRHKEDEVERYRLLMAYGSLMSFIGPMIIPAIGPRFTLHEFANLGKELPGLWLTDPMRSMINAGEGIRASMASSVASGVVFRDAFPSGHTMLTLFTLWTAFHYRAQVRWVLLPLGTMLIISTVLLRYHYVTDVIAGIVLAAITIWTAPMVARVLGQQKVTPQAASNDDPNAYTSVSHTDPPITFRTSD